MNVPYLNRYRHGEFLQYLKDILQLLGGQDVAALQLTAQHDALRPKVAAIDAAFKQEQGSDITQQLMVLDDQRDDALTGLRSVINGYQYHYEEATGNAAKALLDHMDGHGTNIQRLGYQEETAVLDSIIADWEGHAQLRAAVTTLNLTAWLNHLKTANSEFATQYLARVEERAANPIEDIPQFRKEATTLYRTLIAHIRRTAGPYNKNSNRISLYRMRYNTPKPPP